MKRRHSKDTQKSIGLLNKAVGDELQAVHQYVYWHFHLDDQGFGPLADLLKRTAIVEMGHVERVAERILFLKGDVCMAASAQVQRIVEPAEMELQSARDYNKAALECSANAVAVSKQIFEALVGDEEGHFDSFDKQPDNIKRLLLVQVFR